MPFGSMLNSVRLLIRNLDSQKATKMPVEKGKPDKPVIFPRDAKINYLERCKPEDVGYSSEYIESFINELNSDFSIHPNRILIIKDNKVIKSEWRNSANSYGSAIYKFKRGKFVIVKPLQSNQVQDTRLQTL